MKVDKMMLEVKMTGITKIKRNFRYVESNKRGYISISNEVENEVDSTSS